MEIDSPPVVGSSSKSQGKHRGVSSGKHRKTAGYEVCRHTCVLGGCFNRTTKTILWFKEGHSCRRHTCSAEMHPNCGKGEHKDCPALNSLAKTVDEDGVREPTTEELDDNRIDFPSAMEVDAPAEPERQAVASVASVEREESIPLNFSYPLAGPHVRPLTIIYVPDAATRVMNKATTLNDLAFIKTIITEHEYRSMESLEGSIHFLNCMKGRPEETAMYRVIMQEWVSRSQYSLTLQVTNRYFSQAIHGIVYLSLASRGCP